jgi:hypothetical protein
MSNTYRELGSLTQARAPGQKKSSALAVVLIHSSSLVVLLGTGCCSICSK